MEKIISSCSNKIHGEIATTNPDPLLLRASSTAYRYDGIQLWNIRAVPGVRPLVWIISFLSFLFVYPSTLSLLEVRGQSDSVLLKVFPVVLGVRCVVSYGCTRTAWHKVVEYHMHFFLVIEAAETAAASSSSCQCYLC